MQKFLFMSAGEFDYVEGVTEEGIAVKVRIKGDSSSFADPGSGVFLTPGSGV